MTLDRSELALVAAVKALSERKAENLVVLDMRGRIPFADFFIVCHGSSERQVRSLADAVAANVREEVHVSPRKEGDAGAEWILLDYGDMLIHVFSENAREFYRLERLWGDAPHLSPERVVAGQI